MDLIFKTMNKNIISKLWTLLTVNYIFCDVLSLYHGPTLQELLSGKMGGVEFTEPFLLIFSILMEIPMLMIVLCMFLKNKSFKWVNIGVSLLMMIIQIGSLVTGTNQLHYLFFSTLEIMILILIIYFVSQFPFENKTDQN